ncbi:helix-turn-helix domain-containing protein [Microbacterium sp. 18062]|uniref:helix-turn-helix domain-containing protein n=1 Tax=Microbacterium sp. 18062 TaxID=2681410 RepID=UPI0013597C86|nr:PucR family transcriptional regulator [Microbacterium sp. 18062]
MDSSASSPVLLAEAVEQLGLQPVAWAVETSEHATTSVHERERAMGFPPSSTGRARQATERAFFSLLISMHLGRSAVLSGDLPEELRDIIRADVRHGIPLDTLMNRVWSVHTTAKDTLVEAIRELVEPEEFASAMRVVSDSAFDFANDFVRRVAAHYDAERRAWRGRRSEEQFQLALAVAGGASVPPAQDSVLPATWTGRHVWAVAWVQELGFIVDDETEIADFATEVAGVLGAVNVFVFEREGLTYIWWNFEGRGDLDLRSIAALPRPRWLNLVVGPVGAGVQGFRDSHAAAVHAARVRDLQTDRGLLFTEDIDHLVLMLEDRAAAASFVRRELGALSGAEPRVVEIRETVRLYLAEGNSRLAVAKALHLAPNTIAYRVGQANDLLGRGVSDRASQILLALQLLDLVPDLLDETS